MTFLETTDVTSTLCSYTRALPQSPMLVFMVFLTHANIQHTTLKLPPPPYYSGTVTGQVIPIRTTFTVYEGLSCVMVDWCRSVRVHCLYLNADSALRTAFICLSVGGEGWSVIFFYLVKKCKSCSD